MAASQVTGSTSSERDDDDLPPEGFEQTGGDIVAYWEPASPGKGPGRDGGKDPKYWYDEAMGYRPGSPAVTFTPIDCALSDSKLDNSKTSTLLFGRLEKPCMLRSAVESEGYKTFQPGSLIGIWTKPGMRPLQKLAGAVVWMKNGVQINGETSMFKDVDRPSPMVQFDIRHKGKGDQLRVREDRRDKSLPSALKEKRAEVAADLGDIPF